MKKRVSYTEIIDDFDGTPEAQTVNFSLEGSRYEIDLTNANLKELHELLAPYIDRARKVGGKPKAKAKKVAASKKVDSATVRAWAVENNVEVNPTGRVPQVVVEQYKAATK